MLDVNLFRGRLSEREYRSCLGNAPKIFTACRRERRHVEMKDRVQAEERLEEFEVGWELVRLWSCCCSNPNFQLVAERFTVGRRRQCGLLDILQLFQVCTMIKLHQRAEKTLQRWNREHWKRNPLLWEVRTAVTSGRQQGRDELQRWTHFNWGADCHVWGSYRLLPVSPLHPHTHTNT